ncbi:DUF4230 domain-containing protein [Mesonia sp. MT50]|uniref:DUF4230 domain-containing protein n=1 Tax=Mesonia profundi TaxID=3070998 RepID=A0ABU1A1F7_9FLAO|nr:DUF4230 domain-containing protein [Mesonia profundi]MDQ7917540.1 DUF4230 domain-containing protein [Mesonia profundi]
MKKLIIGIIIAVLVVFAYQYFTDRKDKKTELAQTSALIEKEVKNVSKLVVIESSYAQIFTYKNTQNVFMGLTAKKKAILAVNTKATVAYDLAQLQYEIMSDKKVLRITQVPEAELNIYPEFDFYDVSQDYLNQFEADDYNEIKKRVTKQIRKKIEKSAVMQNAENRLASELQKLFILTNSLGWTLEYHKQPIQSEKELEILL